jgi:hypothetical protein
MLKDTGFIPVKVSVLKKQILAQNVHDEQYRLTEDTTGLAINVAFSTTFVPKVFSIYKINVKKRLFEGHFGNFWIFFVWNVAGIPIRP